MRRLFCILLMMCLPLQAFAWQGSDPHRFVHDNDIHHHHDEDGSVHFDDSDASVDHAHDGSTSAQPASIAAPHLPIAPTPVVSARLPDAHRFIAAPFLDGPHRPPARALG